MVRPHIDCAQTTSASVLINADPATVWEAVHSPETARILRSSPAVYSGYVPGTPQGEAGEMQYVVRRRDDGQLTGHVVVVSEISGQHSALTHDLGAYQVETRYVLTPESESGPTRLDLTYRWPAPKLTGRRADREKPDGRGRASASKRLQVADRDRRRTGISDAPQHHRRPHPRRPPRSARPHPRLPRCALRWPNSARTVRFVRPGCHRGATSSAT